MLPECIVALQINDWLLRARDASPGELPALPSALEGGSRAILQEAAAAAQSVMPTAATKGPAKGPGKAAQPPARRGKDAGELAIHPQKHAHVKIGCRSTAQCPAVMT